jgi:hypothetical protein
MPRISALLALAVVGCGGSGFKLAPVSGRVTVEGQPVVGASVTFEPVGSKDNTDPGPGAVGLTDAEGRFTLATVPDNRKGAVVGPCRVRIKVIERGNEAANPWEDPVIKSKRTTKHLPLKYNDQTDLKFDVPANGTTEADFKLSWR